MTDSQLAGLRAQKAEISQRIWDIEARERDERNAALIGKCFRYRNTFGSGDDGWWLYAKVIRADDGNLIAHRFQKNCHGAMEVEPEYSMFHDLNSGYDEISTADFDAAWAAFKAAIASLD